MKQAGKREGWLIGKRNSYVSTSEGEGTESSEGLWAKGSVPGGTGDFVYLSEPVAKGQIYEPTVSAKELHHDLVF
ncbi:hypothetical protein BZG17_34415 [Escherichia coli]|nr:hypothetical protein [Escherichia coli]